MLLTSKGITTLDESTQDEIDDKQLFKDEEFFFEENEQLEENDDASKLKPVWRVSMEWPGDISGYGIHLAYGDNEAEAMANAEAELKSLGIEAKAKCAELNTYTESTKENQVKENRSWYGGGYGGTGKSYSRVSHEGGHTPRGKEIGWYSVSEIDPKARGKMPGWRCGPSNFTFMDLLYPERKYVRGAMVMRNKYVQAGASSGPVQIGVASYFDAIKDNNTEALEKLKLLNIPLDLTFGMDPKADYTNNYIVVNK